MVLTKLKKYGELVMFSHTLFSLPFALIALFLAADGLPSTSILIWSMVALFAGRNGANALNRWVDKDIDKKNPRTANRHIPAGQVKAYEALWITGLCYGLFIFAAYQINSLCFYLSPIALFLFTIYSYTKRFTWLCHIVLGITCAGAPVGAWLAVKGSFGIAPFIIGAVVVCWVAGFDIIYGTQDIDFDRAEKLFSIPAKFGLKYALWIARGLHFSMWCMLVLLMFISNLSYTYLTGVLVSGGLLIMEHYLVDPSHRKKMNVASYHLNQVISVLLLGAAILDIFWI
jgi:4-hydroxybenzoate polyprenyltransferase